MICQDRFGQSHYRMEKSRTTVPVKVAEPKVQLLKVLVIEFAVQVANPFPKHVVAVASGRSSFSKFILRDELFC